MKAPCAERHHVERHHAAEHAPPRQPVAETGSVADAVLQADDDGIRGRVLRDERWLLEIPMQGKPERFFDCGACRDGSAYKDVTGSNDPEVKARFAQLEATPLVFTPKEYGAFLVSESERWGKAVVASGAKAD